MPPEPSVTSACDGPRLCTLRYSSALLPKSFERPGPKSVSPATNCSGVDLVVSWKWISDCVIVVLLVVLDTVAREHRNQCSIRKPLKKKEVSASTEPHAQQNDER